jgi:hypothetical protein
MNKPPTALVGLSRICAESSQLPFQQYVGLIVGVGPAFCNSERLVDGVDLEIASLGMFLSNCTLAPSPEPVARCAGLRVAGSGLPTARGLAVGFMLSPAARACARLPGF